MGGIAKPYLTSYIGGEVEVRLNDGRCQVEESDLLYYFHTSRKSSECGTERRVSDDVHQVMKGQRSTFIREKKNHFFTLSVFSNTYFLLIYKNVYSLGTVWLDCDPVFWSISLRVFFFFQVNKTHFEYQNSLTVSLTKKQKISRRDLKVVWRCVYPRHYIRNAHVSMDMEW